MKKYRLKIPLYLDGNKLEKGHIFTKPAEINSPRTITADFVENNPDIFELIEEPQEEEVIEGYASKIKGNLEIDFRDYKLNRNDVDYEYIDTPARLILNPKKRKEYVRWVTNGGIAVIKNESPENFSSHNKNNEYSFTHKITITVEEEI